MADSKVAYLFPILCVLVAVGVFVIYLVQDSTCDSFDDAKCSETTIALNQNITTTESHSLKVLGDGVCDDDFNTEFYGYDQGDCCEDTSSRDFCQECKCPAEFIYKNAKACSKSKRRLEGCEGIYGLRIGDGRCHIELNTLKCLYDGGDCCLNGTELTCIDGIEFCIESLIGDGKCQDINKGPMCRFDEGDCCQSELQKALGNCCLCSYHDLERSYVTGRLCNISDVPNAPGSYLYDHGNNH